MTSRHPAATDALFERGERAIADAVATRDAVRSGLAAAWRMVSGRPVSLACPSLPPAVDVMPLDALQPWLSVAQTLASAKAVIREANVELDLLFHRVRPTIETPPTFLQAGSGREPGVG